MYACDFEYDGVKLSDLGYIVCEFNGDNGVETANAGSEITFITVPTHSGKRYRTTGTKYDKCLSTSFQICKDPEKYNENEMSITDDEFRELSRWLNRRDYRWFHKDIGDQWLTKSVSGEIVTIVDGAQNVPVKDLTVSIEPAQSGSGDPSPDNVRPISGRTGVTVSHSGADTSDPETLTVSWQTEAGTVYGGSLDVTTGLLTVDRKFVTVSDPDTLTSGGRNYCKYRLGALDYASSARKTYSSVLKRYSGTASSMPEGAFAVVNSTAYNGSFLYLCFPGCSASSSSACLSNNKAYLQTLVNNGITPQFVFGLSSPLTYQLTPQEVATLLGENNIWADTGDTSVEYRIHDNTMVWCDQPWVRASFNLTKIDIGKVTYGAELSMVTDAPFGYGEEQTAALSFAAGALSQTFTDPSDEIGDTYPDMTITCGSSGNLTLSDDMTGCSMEISNCVSGEVLTISGETMTISTSSTTHNATLADDFNYIFFRFGNTFGNRTNTITSSMPCNVVMTYRPIIKDTL